MPHLVTASLCYCSIHWPNTLAKRAGDDGSILKYSDGSINSSSISANPLGVRIKSTREYRGLGFTAASTCLAQTSKLDSASIVVNTPPCSSCTLKSLFLGVLRIAWLYSLPKKNSENSPSVTILSIKGCKSINRK